jgi:FkbM family methyltransferase
VRKLKSDKLVDRIFRDLPLFKGKERLARILLKKDLKEKKDFLIKGKYGCEYFVPNLSENIGFEIYINGIYEESTSRFIAGKMPVNGVFLDLGANIGAITIPVISKRKDIKAVCVEAAPWLCKYLERNLASNGGNNIRCINRALFYTDHETLNFYSPVGKFGKGSLSPVFTKEVIPVHTIKLDTLLREGGYGKVDLIKIDVEGYESHVFRGATELLSRADAPDIIFEFVDWAEDIAIGADIGDSQKFLRGLGYRIFYFKDKGNMEEVGGILTRGFFMLFATKNNK